MWPVSAAASPGAPSQSAVQADGEHFRGVAALGIEHVERVLQILIELFAGIEAAGNREAHIVGIQGIGHDQMWLGLTIGRIHRGPERQVITVVVTVVFKAASFGNQLSGVGAVASGVPAQRRFTSQTSVQGNGLLHMIALFADVHVLVVNPAQAVASDFVFVFDEGLHYLGVSLQCHADTKDGER